MSFLGWLRGERFEDEDDEQGRECDHDQVEWETRAASPEYVSDDDVPLDSGHLVFPVYQDYVRFCQNCYEQMDEETKLERKVAVPIAITMDPDVAISEAVTDPVLADYEVDENGEVAPLGDDGEGRIIINRSENPVEDGD